MGERSLMVVEAQLLSIIHAAHVSSYLSLVNDTLIPRPHDIRAMIPVGPEQQSARENLIGVERSTVHGYGDTARGHEFGHFFGFFGSNYVHIFSYF